MIHFAKRNIVDGMDIIRHTNDDHPKRFRVEEAIRDGKQEN